MHQHYKYINMGRITINMDNDVEKQFRALAQKI